VIIVSYGGGTNSTAMLIGLKERDITPEVITFADTHAEKPKTYEQVETVSQWCLDNGFPAITVVSEPVILEEDCLKRKALPSIAYGFKSCSQRFKLRPQERYFNQLDMAKEVWNSGDKITRCIGFDADEPQRAREFDDPKYQNWYPLIEWDWGRDECIEAIEREGLPLPGKSACFFCPSSKQSEVRSLAVTHPDLMARAIAMEKNADLTAVSGLGRSYSWESLIATDDMFSENFIELDCGCYDG
jgi:hypothetical protein